MEEPPVPAALQRGLESVDLDGVDVLAGPDWNPQRRLWEITCRVTLALPDNNYVPPKTDWLLRIGPQYPWGKIEPYPTGQNPLRTTFPHQMLNLPPSEGNEGGTWTGNVCVQRASFPLGRTANDEPKGQDKRLRWTLDRLKLWLQAAATDSLTSPDDPFELPDFDAKKSQHLVFAEDQSTYDEWSLLPDYGFAEMVSLSENSDLCFLHRVLDPTGTCLRDVKWGKAVRSSTKDSHLTREAWLKLPDVPVVENWRTPQTYGELRETCRSMEVDLYGTLRKLASQLRDGNEHLLLVVFPVPDKWQAQPVQMHVQPMKLPRLSSSNVKMQGFRRGEASAWQKDRRGVLHPSNKITWVKSENGAYSQTQGRGRYSDALTNRKVLLIGAGALGSLLGNLLVRGGVQSLVISDSDRLELGNLSRHAGLLPNIGKFKSVTEKVRLNLSAPHVEVDSIGAFPPSSDSERELLESVDLVLDCTGSDKVLASMGDYDWAEGAYLVSLSLGYESERIFCYASRSSLDLDDFWPRIRPWLEEERPRFAEDELPLEGIGCWHPLFPARIDDITVLVGRAVRWLESVVSNDFELPDLWVYERSNVVEQGSLGNSSA